MNNWKNKLDIPLHLIIDKNDELDCTEFEEGCENKQIVYCFICKEWECHCKHLCDVCGNIPVTDKWIHFICNCTRVVCYDDICRKKCMDCRKYYCRNCVNRYYARRRGKPSTYICKYCTRACKKCNELSLTGLSKCKLCNIKVCSDCSYSDSVCNECYYNAVNKVYEKLIK